MKILTDDMSGLRQVASTLSRARKERLLLSYSEDNFRDRVVRPLFERLGFRDGRDLCGPDEAGKDALFLLPNPFGSSDLYVVQTKKGKINLAAKASANVTTASTQLRTALETTVAFTNPKGKRLPDKAVLCASGKINVAARKHISEELKDPRVVFYDSDDLIPLIDDKFPELWLEIDSDVIPYMRHLRHGIELSSESLAISEMLPGTSAAATDAMFVDLHLWRSVLRIKRKKGTSEKTAEYVEIPVTGIVGKPERLVLILGEAGAGKSTAIRRIAYVMASKALAAKDKFKIPVLLRANDLANGKHESLLDCVHSETQKIAKSSKAGFNNGDLQEGRIVILLDALDEVTDDAEKERILALISDFNQAFPKCQIILTSREIASVRSLAALGKFTHYRVQQFSLKQAGQLVTKLERKGKLSEESSKEILRRLESIHGMELNPLLVTVFAATSDHSRQDIPANITELFKKFTEIMLGRWDAHKGLAQQFQSPLKDFVLCKIAFEMQRDRKTQIGLFDFQGRVTAMLKSRGKRKADIQQLTEEIIRSGLLRVSDGTIEFRHLLLQEFFAGRGIPNPEFLRGVIYDDWWRRSIVFYFGEKPDSTNAISIVRSTIPDRNPIEQFTAACTLGLAIQACYLVEVEDKIDGLVDVMSVLSSVKDDIIQSLPGITHFPLNGFLTYYLYARDSVALGDLEAVESEFRKKLLESAPVHEKEARQFWLIVGLLEAGLVTQAEPLIQQFRPTDVRLQLAIHLGCFLVQHVRVARDEQRKSAKRICEFLAPKIALLRNQVIQEFKSLLLEMHQRDIVSLPSPETES